MRRIPIALAVLALAGTVSATATAQRSDPLRVTVQGEPVIGGTLDVVVTAAAQLRSNIAWVAVSFETGESSAVLSGVPIVWPLADPVTLLDGFVIRTSSTVVPFDIPYDPGLVGLTLWFASAAINTTTGTATLSLAVSGGPIIEDGIS